MIVKDSSVKLDGIQPIMRHAMRWADWIWKDLGQECIITAGTEAVKDATRDKKISNTGLVEPVAKRYELIHSAGSLHYSGLALDFRTRYFDDGGDKAAYELEKAMNDINRGLDSGRFEVIQHKTHIHVEFEPNE